jgi:DNA-binding NtrC family response regulator
MNRELCVLLVHDREEAFWSLEPALKNLGIQTQRAHTCSDARAALRGIHSSGLILTATTLADGAWADVLDLAGLHGRAIPVIVVSRVVDIQNL